MAVTRNRGRRPPLSSNRYPSRSKRPLSSNDSIGSSSDDDQGSSEPESPSSHHASPPAKRRRSSRISQASLQKSSQSHQRPSAKSSSQSPAKTSRQPPPPSCPKRSNPLSLSPPPVESESGVVIPDWTDPRITFECWTNIFHYAASACPSQGFQSGWLVHAATACSLFAEPALTALYHNPYISSPLKAKRLAALLDRPPSETLFNYRAKILTLFLDIHTVPQNILYRLIYPLNRLQELIIYTPLDEPPYRTLDKSMRWHYNSDIFRALEAASSDGDNEIRYKPFPTLVRSWEWSGRLLGGCVATVEDIKAVHQSLPFSCLTKLSITNFHIPWLHKLIGRDDALDLKIQPPKDVAAVAGIAVADAICQLPKLNHLVFESSSIVTPQMLSLLPKNLSHIAFINCWDITSDQLDNFLRSHGSNLASLTLLYNQSLNLAFLTGLAQTCPKLRRLHVDMLCYRFYRSYYLNYYVDPDKQPRYDYALLPNQVPSWPSSLRYLNMDHVRNWSVEAAEMCLQSLVDSADKLPELRHLAIKAVLDIPWQARAAMRFKWREKFENVFLRPFVDPTPHTTLHLPPVQHQDTPSTAKRPRSRVKNAQSWRRSARIQEAQRRHVYLRHSQIGRSLRLQWGAKSYRERDTDEESGEAESTGCCDDDNDTLNDHDDNASRDQDDASRDPLGLHGSTKDMVQGMCHTVNILFDNQKNMEMQWGMEDFVDEPNESEEEEWDQDWDGEDESV
ncbi:hypothetical protein CDD82_3335 [Ophiocordyceps australis]|uniref:Uncharacterized protein n=1 Tax=Ophiocordyceps australis TaxID=1399860 RepID=A0A2C5ZTK7_9HYPO|nr:hypothetical protein CDD82_3335 [Ophiocordyceps australis]